MGVECSRLGHSLLPSRLALLQGVFGQGMWVLGLLLLFQCRQQGISEDVGVPHTVSESQSCVQFPMKE